MPVLANLTIRTLADSEDVQVSVSENGTRHVFTMPTDEACELAQCLSERHGLAVQYEDENGRGTAVSIPRDCGYVAPDAAVYTVTHPVYDTFSAAFSRRDADRIRASEVRDAREADAPMAADYFVSAHTVRTLEVPDSVRLCGRDAVLEYLHG